MHINVHAPFDIPKSLIVLITILLLMPLIVKTNLSPPNDVTIAFSELAILSCMQMIAMLFLEHVILTLLLLWFSMFTFTIISTLMGSSNKICLWVWIQTWLESQSEQLLIINQKIRGRRAGTNGQRTKLVLILRTPRIDWSGSQPRYDSIDCQFCKQYTACVDCSNVCVFSFYEFFMLVIFIPFLVIFIHSIHDLIGGS